MLLLLDRGGQKSPTKRYMKCKIKRSFVVARVIITHQAENNSTRIGKRGREWMIVDQL